VRARSEQVMWREIDGQIVILDLRSSSYLRSNRSGAYLWECLQNECEQTDLVNILQENFDVEPGKAEHDVAEFLVKLSEVDLLE